MRENIRHHYGPGRQWSSDQDRRRYIDEFERARVAARELGRRYVIAPEQSMSTHDGRMLTAGDEVVPERDLAFIEHHRPYESVLTLPVWKQIEKHVFEGRIIDSGFVAPSPPEAA
jgi:hypothetical protein